MRAWPPGSSTDALMQRFMEGSPLARTEREKNEKSSTFLQFFLWSHQIVSREPIWGWEGIDMRFGDRHPQQHLLETWLTSKSRARATVFRTIHKWSWPSLGTCTRWTDTSAMDWWSDWLFWCFFPIPVINLFDNRGPMRFLVEKYLNRHYLTELLNSKVTYN